MDFGLDGKVAFITGAGHGIGRTFALSFAKEGAAVVIADINRHWAEQVASEAVEQGGRALAITFDVGDQDQVNSAIQQTAQHFGPVDVLINDAVSPHLTGSVEELSEIDWDDNFRVNVKGSFYCVKAVTPSMKERRYGKIISMASVVGRWGSALPASAAYAASKAGVAAMTSSVARELGPYNINVNAIAPGHIDTPRWRGARTDEEVERTVQSTAAKRMGKHRRPGSRRPALSLGRLLVHHGTDHHGRRWAHLHVVFWLMTCEDVNSGS